MSLLACFGKTLFANTEWTNQLVRPATRTRKLTQPSVIFLDSDLFPCSGFVEFNILGVLDFRFVYEITACSKDFSRNNKP